MKTIDENVDGRENDAWLVERCRTGEKNAYGSLVSRYKRLVCSLTYSATGDLQRSEELAHETFVTAWKELPRLREPERFRSWLCGIARNTIRGWRRENRRTGVSGIPGEEMESPEPGPAERAVSEEEAELLWRAVAEIPETYREPLILFYRQNRSVEEVAELLDLTEEATRQRLSRGRRFLQDRVAEFVESALARSLPGKALEAGVLAALPVWGISMNAAASSAGAAVAKGTGAAQGWAATAVLGAILGPVIGIVGGIFGVKSQLANARSERERRLIIASSWRMAVAAAGFFVFFGLAMFAVSGAGRWLGEVPEWLAWVLAGSMAVATVLYVAFVLIAVSRFNREQKRIRREEAEKMGAESGERVVAVPGINYRSRRRFLGLPLVAIRSGEAGSGPAVGWIALGDFAVGGLFAGGGVAIAPLSAGGATVGLVSFGGATVALAAVAGLSVAVWSSGGVALGWFSFGGVALAWEGAMGGIALAREFALGGIAQAAVANSDAAATMMRGNWFFRFILAFYRQGWIWVGWLPCLLAVWPYWRARRRKNRERRA